MKPMCSLPVHKPQGEELFYPIELKDITYTKKTISIGELLLKVCKEYLMIEFMEIRNYHDYKS